MKERGGGVLADAEALLRRLPARSISLIKCLESMAHPHSEKHKNEIPYP